MTRQDIFTRVFKGLASQNFERSINAPSGATELPRCMYRDDHGRKCAAGWLIPDYAYNPLWEGNSARTVGYIRETYNEHIVTVMELQRIHDNSSSPVELLDALIEYARAHNLEIPECPTSSEL